MTADMQTEVPTETPVRARRLWPLSVAAVIALVVAVGAGFYRHEQINGAEDAAAQATVSRSETRDVQTKVAAAQQTLETARQQLRERAASSSGLLSALDRLNANHRSMDGVVRDQGATSAQIVDVLAGAQFATYNTLADRFTSSNRTVDALATNESNLQEELTRSNCGDSCVYSDTDSVNLPDRQHGTGDGTTRFFDFPPRWDFRYDYHCSAGTKTGYFDVVVQDQNGSFLEGAVSESTLSGQGVVHKSGAPYPATAQLAVHSNCPWNITLNAA